MTDPSTPPQVPKWVYPLSGHGDPDRELLGAKGAELANLAGLGLPVPPGFTITTRACRHYLAEGIAPDGLWDQVKSAMEDLEAESGRMFGAGPHPLLVSVRSGAAASMPGMMETILNVGINDEVAALFGAWRGESLAIDLHRRFIEMYAQAAMGVSPAALEAVKADARASAGTSRIEQLDRPEALEMLSHMMQVVEDEAGETVPFDPLTQLRRAIEAVFRSWNSRRAIDYRTHHGIPADLGTAVTVMAMVYGNAGNSSCSGVLFTRDPATGERQMFGEYLPRSQGEDVVAGIETPRPLGEMTQDMPDVHSKLLASAERIEAHYGDAQDIEFTVEDGRPFILQTRAAKRSARAAVRIAVEMCEEGVLTQERALMSVSADRIQELLLPRLDQTEVDSARNAGRLMTVGLGASPGGVSGAVALSADRAVEMASGGQHVILVRPETSAEDVHGMIAAGGVLTARGGATSHAAVVARGMGKPCVVGTEGLLVRPDLRQVTCGGRSFAEGDMISLDGDSGEVFRGAIATVEPSIADEHHLRRLLIWADEHRRLGVRANADTAADAALARELGADGVGLCRTEHMFFDPERLELVRRMILAASARARWSDDELIAWRLRDALSRLQEIQARDFEEILREMDGMPVVIRLLDPPLHEFLPTREELLEDLHRLRADQAPSEQIAEREEMLAAAEEMRESNPMLGLRGCRLGIVRPEIFAMQVVALARAVSTLRSQGLSPQPEVMVPLVSDAAELGAVRSNLAAALAGSSEATEMSDNPRIGAMIETPRAALTADSIAGEAEFLSFGTNDLTQLTFGFSRDDAEGGFLAAYLDGGVLGADPFRTVDRTGVGSLVEVALEKSRSVEPDLEAGVCGEHGGDPPSIAFFEEQGIDYVSCSPYRVPVARIAAAQATISLRNTSAE